MPEGEFQASDGSSKRSCSNSGALRMFHGKVMTGKIQTAGLFLKGGARDFSRLLTNVALGYSFKGK